MRKRLLIVSIFLSLLLLSIGTIYIFNSNKKSSTSFSSNDNNIKLPEEIKEIEETENNITESNINEVVEEEKTTTSPIIKNDKDTSNKNNNKEIIVKENSKDNTATSKVEKEQVIEKENPIQNEIKEEKPIIENENNNQVENTTNKETNTQYIGVPNPNDFYYSLHKGRIDDAYTTLDGCYNKSIEVAFLDTNDITNAFCYEVLDGKGAVLGIYMSVKCNSGNCERYKEMVGINTN